MESSIKLEIDWWFRSRTTIGTDRPSNRNRLLRLWKRCCRNWRAKISNYLQDILYQKWTPIDRELLRINLLTIDQSNRDRLNSLSDWRESKRSEEGYRFERSFYDQIFKREREIIKWVDSFAITYDQKTYLSARIPLLMAPSRTPKKNNDCSNCIVHSFSQSKLNSVANVERK